MADFVYTTAIDKIRRMKKRIKIIPGGSSAGKTYGIIPILIDKAIATPNTSISIVSESMPHLRKGCMKDFADIMKMIQRWDRFRWNATNSQYTFANGSYIEFFSVEDETSVRGPRRNILYINECNKVAYDTYIQLAMRTDGDIYLDYNPSHRFWTEDVMLEDDAEMLVLTYKDNEALSQNTIDFLESKIELAKTSDYWKNWVNVYLYGQLGSLEGVVFSNWKVIDGVPEEAELIGGGMDFGFSNDPTTLSLVYRYNGELIIDEIIHQKGLSNNEINKLLKINDVKCDIICDSADPKSIEELRKYGHRTYPAKKGPDSILYGISILQSYKINITRQSVNVIDEFTKYSWKKDTNGNGTINVPIDIYNHQIDAIRYLAMAKLDTIKGKKHIDYVYAPKPFNPKHKF